MTQFSKFILASMIIIVSASISTSLYSMQGKQSLAKSTAGIHNRTQQQAQEAAPVEAVPGWQLQRYREYRRGVPSECGPCLLFSVCVGGFLACHLGLQALQYLLNN